MIEQLNLPPFDIKFRKRNNKVEIFDILRKNFVALTPEEWVRQHFIHFLIHEKGYPESFMANEIAIKFNGMDRRCDTVVYRPRVLPLQPIMVIEYKRPDVAITQRVIDQISRYNMVLRVNYLIVSNGLDHYCIHISDYDKGEYSFLEEIPVFDVICNEK